MIVRKLTPGKLTVNQVRNDLILNRMLLYTTRGVVEGPGRIRMCSVMILSMSSVLSALSVFFVSSVCKQSLQDRNIG